MGLLFQIKNNNLIELFVSGNFGIEKEGLRVKIPATLSDTMHPTSIGNHENQSYITTDYGEAQPEIITPPLSPYFKTYEFLQTLSYVLLSSLPTTEYIWPFSVPCDLPEEEKIKISQTMDVEEKNYRLYTAEKYGKKRQLISGIHINYSFNDKFIEKIFKTQKEFETIPLLQNELYLKLASNFLRYQWLLIYLFGATPIAEENFFDGPFFEDKQLPTEPMRSLRNSKFGFKNEPRVVIRYDKITNYVNDLKTAIDTGLLAEEREYYGDVRLRGFTKESVDLLNTGIQYVEVRSFDNDPFYISGLSIETLQFIHLFFLTMVSLSEKVPSVETEKGENITETVANEHPYSKTIMYDEGIWLLKQMQNTVEFLELDEKFLLLIEDAIDSLKYPERTLAARITSLLEKNTSLLDLGELIGRYHKRNIEDIALFDFKPSYIHEQSNLVYILQEDLTSPTKYFQSNEDTQLGA